MIVFVSFLNFNVFLKNYLKKLDKNFKIWRSVSLRAFR